MTNKAEKIFMSPRSLKLCLYLWAILLLITPAAYIYDYSGFEFVEFRSFVRSLVIFYTFGLLTYVEILRIEESNLNKRVLGFLTITSYLIFITLLILFGLSINDYIDGKLELNNVYDPVIELFFLYLISKGIADLKQNTDDKEALPLS